MLFGYDVADINFDRSFELFSLLDIFGECKVVYPDALPVITAMMQNGLKDVMRHQEDPDSPSSTTPAPPENVSASTFKPGHRPRARSMELAKELQTRQTLLPDHVRVARDAAVLQTVIRFLADLHARSANFRDFALSSDYIRLLFSALYPAIVSADPVTPDTELNSRDSTLTFEGADVIIRPLGGGSAAISTRGRGGSGGGGDGGPPGVVRQNTSAVDGALRPPPGPGAVRGTPLRKASSFILLPSQKTTQPEEASPTGASQAHLTRAVTPRKTFTAQKNSNALVEGLLELVIIIFEDQVLARKEFPGFGLYLRVPPGFQEHQAYFESYVLLHTISHLGNTIQLNQKVLTEPRILTNVARFCMHVVEAVFEGWFMGGAEPTMDFIGHVLEYLQRSEIAALKSVRLCSQAVAMIRTCFLKLVLLRLSEMDEGKVTNEEGDALMAKLFYWQTVLLSCLGGEDNVDNMRLLWYQLYTKLVDKRETVRLAAANIWRITLVQKPDESAALFRQAMASDNQAAVASGFRRLTEVDNETFVEWVDAHRPSLDVLFLGGMSRAWEEFVTAENARTTETARQRLLRRKDRLRAWHAEQLERENVLLRHEMANSAWQKSIYFTEHFKHQRLAQDQQDDNAFLASTFEKMDRDLRRPGAVFAPDDGYPGATGPTRWKLDRTEGRNRMRVRLLPDHSRVHDEYQPKRRATESPAAPAAGSTLRVNTGFQQSGNTLRTPVLGSAELAASPAEQGTDGNMDGYSSEGGQGAVQQHPPEENAVSPEDDFELVDDPNEPNDGEEQFEDKNRKVMRRLEHGDQVQHVYNVSRIIGIDTCEGILIIGKEALYLMDNVFRNQDGEIINVWQAPREERDPFSQIIGGHNAGDKRQHRSEQESRSWRWHDVISISKRRYIFRDVAIEIFFTDGRSYLLTAMNSPLRDEIYAKLMAKAAHTVAANQLPNPEDAWRLESVKIFDEGPQTTVFGAKFGSIFNASPWNPIMRRWQRGEMSNFHYLMMVNTMAGRTFNDLTQYPVFPWVLADYTSEELDLDDPRSFRDLTRPMGAQTAGRQSDFKLRYRTLAEIGETPFHYGTHYSSAMIVCSYLIRLPPFVQSFILLQGGSFDHPDRLFHSIEGAWRSASRDNGSDVRELIPEFFYLPDFLTNINGYNFGERQGGAGRVDNVVLPPWAKGDPKIFVHRMREALESPYVSRNLHHWIDLIFGYKQRGEAAVENLNVFHHLSYHGAKDLDNITDPQERAITTGIIHNFGQTPHQVFSKPHPPREVIQSPIRRLDNAVFALARLPHPLLGKFCSSS